MIHCIHCKKRIRDGQKVIEVGRLVENESRGDFVHADGPNSEVLHLKCLRFVA